MARLSQNQKLINFLSKGNTINADQAYARFDVANLSARVDELRASGYPIYNNGGKYALGRPSKKMVAAAYRFLGGRAFS